jgi:hypothetical protein
MACLTLPSRNACRARLGDFDTRGQPWSAAAERAVGLAQAEIVRAAEDAAKTMLLAGGKWITAQALADAIEERRRASVGG